ncbi:5-formyltetrahydrofolate cyclo-ligase [Gilvimarinus polysaccharolyticus]|uniref:5-formyltetrahydrofolate cyclo-ligase n=1 Tax=Gilvimarinus polysaccharolyticus TaxID=863921 RepID=UPI0006731D99|nr:5-formyltetrahydrofolate cyclo-ligase [Gilvimarinus polysaccharolyticus]
MARSDLSATPLPTSSNRRELRRVLRTRRRSLSPAQQMRASAGLRQQLQKQPWFNRAQRIALYWPADGEIDPRPIAAAAWQRHKRCYLPVLHRWLKRRLWFTPFARDTQFGKNRFGIPEPIAAQRLPRNPRHLDVVLVPLVGFDRSGGRLGMGGGFYDTTFAAKRRGGHFKRPRLVGVAHSCQEVAALELASWDVPLDGIATEREYIAIAR